MSSVCCLAVAVMEESNLEKHYMPKHAWLNELKGQMKKELTSPEIRLKLQH